MCFFKKKIKQKNLYDIANEKPVIRASICTGEKVAGFLNKTNGTFKEVALIKNQQDLLDFCKEFGIENTNLPIIY